MTKFSKIPTETFKKLQMNAGILTSAFVPATGTIEDNDIIGATSGGVAFEATPSFSDFGEDIDNCPKNTKELKRLDDWEVKMSGTFVTVDTKVAKLMVGLADIDTADPTKVVPRTNIDLTKDFADIWWVGDYSDVTTGDNAGFLAIHLMNALSSGGFKLQSGDKAKGQFEFEFTGHFSMDAQDTVPFEIYAKTGTAA